MRSTCARAGCASHGPFSSSLGRRVLPKIYFPFQVADILSVCRVQYHYSVLTRVECASATAHTLVVHSFFNVSFFIQKSSPTSELHTHAHKTSIMNTRGGSRRKGRGRTLATSSPAKRSSIHAASKVAKVWLESRRRGARADQSRVAKVGPSASPGEAGSNLLKSDRRRRLTKRASLHKKRSSLRGRTKVAKVGPLRARVKSA